MSLLSPKTSMQQSSVPIIPKVYSTPLNDTKQVLFECHGEWLLLYLGAHTSLALLILLVAGSLVQLGPEGLGPPGGEPGLQTTVERLMVLRV